MEISNNPVTEIQMESCVVSTMRRIVPASMTLYLITRQVSGGKDQIICWIYMKMHSILLPVPINTIKSILT